MPKAKQAATDERLDGGRDADDSLLAPFISHGVDVSKVLNGQAVCLCPFCGKQKFHIAFSTGLADCKTCGWAGNSKSFLSHLWEVSFDATPKDEYEELRQERGYPTSEGVIHWGCCKSVITNEWLVPGYNADGTLRQLYRWVKQYDSKTARWFHSLWLTKGLHAHDSHGLHGVPLRSGAKTVMIAEGVWDGIAVWHALREAKRSSEFDVIAVPGCTIWQTERWAPIVSGKKVVILYDSDHPRVTNSGLEAGLEGFRAAERLTRKLSGMIKPPQDISYLKWGDLGFDPEKKSGWDVRDLLYGESHA